MSSTLGRVARHAGLRFLQRRKSVVAVAIATMALAIGANTAAFSVVRAFLLSSLGVPDADRLMIVGPMRELPGRGRVLFADAYPNYELLRSTQKAFSEVATAVQGIASWDDGEQSHSLASARVTASFFATMRVSPARGRAFARAEEGPSPARVALISDGLWRSRFASDPGVLGKTLSLNGELHEIVGVMPPRFALPVPTDVWLPFDIPPQQRISITGARSLTVFGRIAPTVSKREADADARALTLRTVAASKDNNDFAYEYQPIRQTLLAGADDSVLLVQWGAFVLLALAVLNLASVLLAWGFEQRTELAVRRALGGRTGDVGMLLVFQAFAVVAAGALLGFGVAAGAVRWLSRLDVTPQLTYFAAQIRLDWATVAGGVAVTIVAALAASAISLWFATRGNLAHDLRAAGRSVTLPRAAVRWQAGIVVAQAATSVVVLVVAALVGVSFYNLSAVRPGFDAGTLVVARVNFLAAAWQPNPAKVRYAATLLDKLAAEPSIAAAAFTSTLPVGDQVTGARFFAPQQDGTLQSEPFLFHMRRVSANYLDVLGVPLADGRHFDSRDDTASRKVVIVSRSLAQRLWPNQSALEKQLLRFMPGGAPPEPYTVIGVAGDVMDAGNGAPPGETVYAHWPQWPNARMSVVVSPRGDVAAALGALRKAMRDIDAAVAPHDVRALADLQRQATEVNRLRTALLAAFALIALLINCIGVYGVMSQIFATREREFALRLALGASPASLARAMLARVARLVMPGTVLGVVIAIGMGGLLRRFVFGVEQGSPTIMLSGAAVLLAIAFAATAPLALKAARTKPQASMS
jgi:putative ABC transport system permease protein